MTQYIIRRVTWAIPTLILISIISFVIIQLPPGDYLTSYIANLRATGEEADELRLQKLEERYALGKPIYMQYLKWIGDIVLKGDFGDSMEWEVPVAEIIGERLGLTVVISLSTLLVTWLIAIPIGVFSATHQYSLFDYVFTFIGFVGAGIPNFLLALVLMWVFFAYFNMDVGGLFSDEFKNAPWSLAKIGDMISHMWVPLIVLGTGGTAGLIRTVRANMLDELHKPYVETARAKGLSEWRLVWKYPVKVALNPFLSTVGWALPGLVSGSIITAVVLNLPTTGTVLLRALLSQDMYLAGSFIMMLSVLTVIGTLISDILLAWVDPRIRM